jgi:site-specific recombinase XerD
VSDHIADIIQEVIYSNGIPNRKYLFCLLGSESRYKNYPNPVRRILDSVINDTRDDKNKLTVRDFRNVFATRLINKGMNLSHIQNLLNHKTPAMTMRYARMLDTTGGDELKEMFVGVKL